MGDALFRNVPNQSGKFAPQIMMFTKLGFPVQILQPFLESRVSNVLAASSSKQVQWKSFWGHHGSKLASK